jgi:hypothetical protein
MKFKVRRVVEIEIERCIDCPYFRKDMDGNMCFHPDFENLSSIYLHLINIHTESGFPKDCPLQYTLEERGGLNMRLTDWDEVSNYEWKGIEEIIVKKLFEEYLDANSCFEEMSKPEIEDHYRSFKHGWYMALHIQDFINGEF